MPETFQIGEVWESPKGTLYKVIETERNGTVAIMRTGMNGDGRKMVKRRDEVRNWKRFYASL